MDEDINNLYLSFKTEKDPFIKAKILLKLKKDKNIPIKEIGKNVENIGFETKFSYHLKQECDNFRKLSKKEVQTFFEN